MPALHTRTSSGFCKASTAAQKAAAPSAEPISPATPFSRACGWLACVCRACTQSNHMTETKLLQVFESCATLMSATAALVVASDLPLITTRALASASLIAIALPMPEVLPVTTASLPCRPRSIRFCKLSSAAVLHARLLLGIGVCMLQHACVHMLAGALPGSTITRSKLSICAVGHPPGSRFGLILQATIL